MIFLKKGLDNAGNIADDDAHKDQGAPRPEGSLNNTKRKAKKMNNKIVRTNAKLSDGSPVVVKGAIGVPSSLEELKTLAAEALETADETTIDRHLTDLFVSWCIAHTYQSQVRSKLRTASPNLTPEQLSEVVSSVPFRIPRPASAPRGDKVTIKRSQLTPEQIEKLREMGIL